jgi:hypothetical protein
MARALVDVEHLLVALLDVPPATVMVEPDVDAVDQLPLVILRIIDGSPISNGRREWAQRWLIGVSVLASGRKAASDLADAVYAALHELDEIQARAAGIGYVQAVEDEALPIRVATVVAADNLTQFDARYSVTIRPDV